MASLRDRLTRLEQSTGRSLNRQDGQEQGGHHQVARARSSDISEVDDEGLVRLGFEFVPWVDSRDADYSSAIAKGYWRRTLRYDLLTYHGNRRFGDVLECDFTPLLKAARISFDEGHAEASMDARNLRFYDTETSGLGTGAGTFPFLHAVAAIDEDDIVLEQYFLKNHAEEGLLLRVLWNRHFAHPNTIVVSFNGKSYDWPLLKSRLVMHRVTTETDRQHIDLLPLSRRLWKTRLGKVKLSYVEEHILQLERIDDLPGSEAPARYFAYVDSGDASPLAPVFQHNAADVCSLIVLTATLGDILGRKSDVQTAAEYVALGKWHDEWGETDIAYACYRHANQRPDSDWNTLWVESMHERRHGKDAEAVRVWLEMVERYRWTRLPLVELAKHAEHKVKDLDAAIQFTEEAIRRTVEARRVSPSRDALRDEFRALKHRLDRIRAKWVRESQRHPAQG